MTYYILAMTYTWWRGDDLSPLPPLPDFRCERVVDVPLLAKLHKVEATKIEERLADANSAYVAFIEDKPAGYGWSGVNSVGVAEVFWPMTPQSRGLWDFFTLESARGRGIYPHLLQAILCREQNAAEKFWIGHRVDNLASKRGIEKAGFALVTLGGSYTRAAIAAGTAWQPVPLLRRPAGQAFGVCRISRCRYRSVRLWRSV